VHYVNLGGRFVFTNGQCGAGGERVA